MALYSGSYENLLKGVTSKAATLSADFVAEQENFIPNPHYGLVRRGGSKRFGVSTVGAGVDNINSLEFSSIDYTHNDIPYYVMYPTKGTPMVLSNIVVINKLTGEVSLKATYDTFSVATVFNGDVLLVNNNTPTHSTRDQLKDGMALRWLTPYPEHPRGYFCVTVRTGKYKTSYKVIVYRTLRNSSGVAIDTVRTVTMAYTTRPLNYDGILTLDTSSIPASATDYQKQVNDKINSYNTAVNDHTLAAGLDIITDSIANQLLAGRVITGATGVYDVVYRTGNTLSIPKKLVINPSGDYYEVDDVVVTVDDSYNPQTLVTTFNELTDVTLLPPTATVGEVVQLGTGEKAAYFAAIPSGIPYEHGEPLDNSTVVHGYPINVYWQEVSRYAYSISTSQVSRLAFNALGSLVLTSAYDVGGTPYAGNLEFSPVPEWYSKAIDYIGVIQNRLLIICNGTFYFSETGTANFFVKSVYNITPKDAISVKLLSNQGFSITASVVLEQATLFFDGINVFSLDTRSVITPTSINITAQGVSEVTTRCKPINVIDTVFVASDTAGHTEVAALTSGDFATTLTTSSLSAHVDTYIEGSPTSLAYIQRSKILVVKTDITSNSFYGCVLLATSNGVSPSWFKITLSELHGKFVGMYVFKSKLYLVWLRDTYRDLTNAYNFVIDELDLNDPTPSVFIDSYRPATFDYTDDDDYEYDIPAIGTSNQTAYVSFDDDSSYMGLISSDVTEVTDEVTAFLADCYAGFMYTASVTPNSPRIKDSNDKSIVSGRLVISNVKVETANTVAIGQTISGYSTSYLARYTGNSEGFGALVSKYTPTDRTVTVFIGRETREYNLTLSSITWLPLTITNIEWNGQLWSNRRPTKGG